MDRASIDAWVLGMSHPSAFRASQFFLVDPVAVSAALQCVPDILQ